MITEPAATDSHAILSCSRRFTRVALAPMAMNTRLKPHTKASADARTVRRVRRSAASAVS